MGIKVGGIDLANAIIKTRFDLLVLQRVVEYIMNNNITLIKPTSQQLDEMRKDAVERLQKEFPEAGIDFKKD